VARIYTRRIENASAPSGKVVTGFPKKSCEKIKTKAGRASNPVAIGGVEQHHPDGASERGSAFSQKGSR